MNQNQVLLLVREALAHNPGYQAWTLSTVHLEIIVNTAIKIEREACAKACEEIAEQVTYQRNSQEAADKCADAIRARGE